MFLPFEGDESERGGAFRVLASSIAFVFIWTNVTPTEIFLLIYLRFSYEVNVSQKIFGFAFYKYS